MHTVQYIDQLHHKLLHQIHSVGLPPQLIKGRYTIWLFIKSLLGSLCVTLNLGGYNQNTLTVGGTGH